jgi:Flp pilus assembly protein TadD
VREYNEIMRTFRLVLAAAVLCLLEGCATWEGASLYRSGTAALDRGDARGAIADLERAAELVPEASAIQNHLGLAYAAAGREDDALVAFRRAVVLDCDNAAAQQNLDAALGRHAGVLP